MRRWLSNMAVAVLAAVCLALVVHWPISYVFGYWFAVRRADVTYNVISDRGWVVLQRAHLRYVPTVQGWTCSHGRCGGQLGPIVPSSVFEYAGLVDARIRIPWDVNPAAFPGAFASTIQATGRNISIPTLLLVAVTGYAPASAVMRRIRQRQQARRRGFDAASSDAEPANAVDRAGG